MIKQLFNLVIANTVICQFRKSIIFLGLQQIIDQLGTDKSTYFAPPRPIIVNYLQAASIVLSQSTLLKLMRTLLHFHFSQCKMNTAHWE